MRLFAGIELDAPMRERCTDVQRRLRLAAFGASYESPEKLHMTLAFLGNVREEHVAEVGKVLERVAEQSPSFDLIWDRVSAFPNERRPRIVFVGSRAPAPAFRELAYGLRREYERLGFTFKEDAVAHITVARVKGGSATPLPMIELAPHEMPVRTLALFESLSGGGTTRYEVRSRYPVPTT